LEQADYEWIAKHSLPFPQFALSMKIEDDIGGLLNSTTEELIDAETRKVLIEILVSIWTRAIGSKSTVIQKISQMPETIAVRLNANRGSGQEEMVEIETIWKRISQLFS
jgi:hypothetical protein